jgi:hypothetical protein
LTWECCFYPGIGDVTHIVSEKLGVNSDNYKFVGYPKELIGYYFYDLIEQKVFVSKYVTFLEKEFVLEKSSERK